jgi:hypothetical protein
MKLQVFHQKFLTGTGCLIVLYYSIAATRMAIIVWHKIVYLLCRHAIRSGMICKIRTERQTVSAQGLGANAPQYGTVGLDVSKRSRIGTARISCICGGTHLAPTRGRRYKMYCDR